LRRTGSAECMAIVAGGRPAARKDRDLRNPTGNLPWRQTRASSDDCIHRPRSEVFGETSGLPEFL
jgi:hypothetical protein